MNQGLGHLNFYFYSETLCLPSIYTGRGCWTEEDYGIFFQTASCSQLQKGASGGVIEWKVN